MAGTKEGAFARLVEQIIAMVREAKAKEQRAISAVRASNRTKMHRAVNKKTAWATVDS